MTALYAATNRAVLEAFGEAVAFTTRSGVHTVTGVVERPVAPIGGRAPEQAALPGAVHGPDDMRVTVLGADVADAGIAVRDTAIIDGSTYTVNGLWPDAGGMTALELRA